MMIALDPSHISYPSVEVTTERKFTSVVSLSEKNIDTVLKTIKCWRESLRFIERAVTSVSDFSLMLAEDYTLIENYRSLLTNIKETALWIIKDSTYPIQLLLSFDSLGEIQSMASYSFTDSSGEILERDAYLRYDKPELAVCRLITAPFNVRWKTSFSVFPPPMRGGGTLLVHALFQLAQINKNPKIWLKAIESAVPFYTNLGMSKLEDNYFELVLSDEAQCHQFKEVYQKAFGDSFNYSLFLTGRVSKRCFSTDLLTG